MASDLVRGAYAGHETYLYYNSGTNAAPVWVEVARARNIIKSDGSPLQAVEFHGGSSTRNISGYKAFSGSFEYVRRSGTDAVWTAIETAANNRTAIEFVHLNGPNTSTASIGWRAPLQIGEIAQTDNGNDPVVATVPFGLADAYDADGNQVEKVPFTGTDPANLRAKQAAK